MRNDRIDVDRPVLARDKQVLDERWRAYRAGKAKRISRLELERRLKRKGGASRRAKG